jgi:hypothetical protein
MRYLVLLVALSIIPGCAKAPPTSSPQAQTAFRNTQIIKTLDLLRDTAIEANASVPPLVSTSTTRKVVQAHQSILLVMRAAQTGWQNTAIVALDEILKNLPANEATLLAPYVTLAKVAINEVLR